MACAQAVRAYEHTLVQPCSEKIDRHEGRADGTFAITELLTKQQLLPAQGRVAVAGNGVAYDAAGNHEEMVMSVRG
jgi:hypothetical protein